MPRALHQISAAIPVDVFGCIGPERRGIQKCPIPELQAPAQAERPMHVRGFVGLFDRRQAMLQVSVQRVHVFVTDLGIRRIRHGGVQVMPSAVMPLRIARSNCSNVYLPIPVCSSGVTFVE